nr:chromogranin-A isoform X3 [Caretta caretta]
MGCRGGFAVLLLAVQVLSLPVTNPVTKGDAKVMKCIVEVISDTLSKPSPLPISQECLETLRGDERIISILRHQNLLKELQELAVQDKSREIAVEKPTASFAELAAERSQQNSEREESKEDEENSLEERELRLHEAGPEDDKENAEESDSNEVSEAEELPREDALDNHINDNLTENELAEHKLQEAEEEQPEETNRSQELQGEKKHISKKGQEESREVEEETLQEHTAEEDARRSTLEDEQPTEADRILGSAEDETEETPREGDNKDALGFGQGLKSSEEEKSHGLKGGRHGLEDEAMQAEDTFHPRDVKSEEVEEEPSRAWEDSKRWNKMDELAKQLTSKKRMEEYDSSEDPDRSMKMSFRSHKYDFHNPEEDRRRSWKHHAKEDSSEAGFPFAAMPEEKKDEEGSANRRTEDQELESLAAIEAELEKVAHKLHELRRG